MKASTTRYHAEYHCTRYHAEYHWRNIRTGAEGVSHYQGESLHALLVFLNRCNSQSPGQWQYWY